MEMNVGFYAYKQGKAFGTVSFTSTRGPLGRGQVQTGES